MKVNTAQYLYQKWAFQWSCASFPAKFYFKRLQVEYDLKKDAAVRHGLGT